MALKFLRIQKVSFFIFLWGVMSFSLSVHAATPAWQIVPDKSSLTFTATQNGSPVTGEFKTFSGEIQFDPTQLVSSHVAIQVNMGSVVTSYGQVADTLKTPDWFNIKLFPQAVFKASSFKKISDNTYQADGTLTIRDKTIPIVLTFTWMNVSKQSATVKGTTTLKRTQFGIGQGDWSSTDQVKDDVQVQFNALLKTQ